jgi:hypothetical protein
MGFGSRLKKKAKKYANKIPQVKIFKKVKGMFSGGSGDSGGDEGMRSEAAKRLVNKNQQAGSGSINFNTEEYVE